MIYFLLLLLLKCFCNVVSLFYDQANKAHCCCCCCCCCCCRTTWLLHWGWNSGEMRIKIGCEKIIWPSTFEDNCSSSVNITALVTEYWCEAYPRQQVGKSTKQAQKRSCLVWKTRMAWDQLKCHLRKISNDAILCHSSKYGPTFGAGCDLFISNNANTNTSSYSRLGCTYERPSGQQQTFFTESKNFTVTDYEVFGLHTLQQSIQVHVTRHNR